MTKPSHEQITWLQQTLHADVIQTKRHVNRLNCTTPMSMFIHADKTHPDLSVVKEPIYEIHLSEHDLTYLIKHLQEIKKQNDMSEKHPIVREAWMNLRMLMIMLDDANSLTKL